METNAGDLIAGLRGMSDRVGDLRPAWDDVARLMDDVARDHFDSGGSGSWPPLDPATIRRKGSSQVLVQTGRLRRAMADNTADSIRQATMSALMWGTTVPYAQYVARRRNPIPDVDGVTADRIVDLLEDHVTGGVW